MTPQTPVGGQGAWLLGAGPEGDAEKDGLALFFTPRLNRPIPETASHPTP